MFINKIRLRGPLPIVIALVLLLVFFGEFFLERTLSSEAIRTLLKDKIHQALAVDFSYQDIELDFLPLSLQFVKVQASRGDQQFAADHIAAGVSAWSLFMGEIKLGKVQITKPSYRLKHSVSTSTKTSRRWPTINNRYLERLVIIDPDIEVEIAGNNNQQQLTINGGRIVANFAGKDQFSATIEVDDLNYVHGDKSRLKNAKLRASLELLRDNFTLTIAQLEEQHIESLTGSWRGQAIVDNQRQITGPLTVRGQGKFRGDLAVLDAQLGIEKTSGVAQANFKIDLIFSADKPVYYKATGLAQVKEGQLGGIKLYDSSTQLTVTPKTLRFADGKLAIVGKERGNFSGWIAFTRGTDFDFTADIERLSLAEILAAFGIDKFDVFNFDINSPKMRVYGHGKPLSLRVIGDSTISQLAIKKLTNHSVPPLCQTKINIRSTNKGLSFNKIKAQCQTADRKIFTPLTIDGSIFYKSRKINIGATSKAFDLSTLNFLVNDKISGKAELATTIGGLTNNLKIDTSLTVNEVVLAGKQLGRGKVELTVGTDQLLVDKLRFRPAGGGVIDLQRASLSYQDLQFAAHLVKAKNLAYRDLRWLTNRYRLPVAFAVNNFQATINKGYLLQPLAYYGDLQVNLTNIKSNKQKIADNLRLRAISDKRGWRVAVRSLQIAGANLRGNLSHQRKVGFQHSKFAESKELLTRLGISSRDKLFLTLIGGSNSQPQPLPYLPADYFRSIFAEAKLTVSGSVNALQAKLVTKMRQTGLFGMQIGAIQMVANLDNKQLTLDINTPDQTASGQMAIEVWRPGFPFNWQLQFDRFDVQQLLMVADKESYARLSGHWYLRGKLDDWWNSRGEFVSTDFLLRYRNKDLTTDQTLILQQQQTFKLLFDDGRLTLAGRKRVDFKSEHSMLSIEIADSNRPNKLAVDFYGVIDGKILPIFFQEVDVASGFLQLQGKVRGKINNPQVAIDVERLSPLSISVAGLRPAFNDIDVKAKYHAGQLVIEDLSGQKGDGSIRVRGQVQVLANRRRSATANFLQIDLQNAKFVHPILGFKSTELNIIGQLNLRWQKLPINVSGNLTISRASNFSDFDIRKVIIASFGKKKYRTSLVDHQPTVVFSNLNIVADQSLTIENRNMQALLSAQLQILGTNIAPEVSGFVRVDKGKFIYRRNFIVTHGLISFDGGLDPMLDLRAYSEVSSYVVNLVISGPASDPVAELTINPAIRDDGTLITKMDILTLLNRGTLPLPGTEISNAGNTGVSEVANVLIGQFERPLEKLLRRSGQNIINQIYIDTHTSPKGVLYPKLTAPINLPWNNWDLNVQVDPYTWRLLGEYLIHDGISLSGTISGKSQDDQLDVATTTNDQAVDLKFRFSIP